MFQSPPGAGVCIRSRKLLIYKKLTTAGDPSITFTTRSSHHNLNESNSFQVTAFYSNFTREAMANYLEVIFKLPGLWNWRTQEVCKV